MNPFDIIGAQHRMNHLLSRNIMILLATFALVSIFATVSRAAPDDDVKALGSSKSSEQEGASERLRKAADKAVPALLKGLDDSSEQVKIKSLWVLRQIKTASNDLVAASIGLRRRSEKSKAIRIQMVQTLRGFPGGAAQRELKGFVNEDADEEVRWLAIHHLGRVSKNENQFMKQHVNDPSHLVSLAAYTELAELGDKSGRDIALQTMNAQGSSAERMEAMDLLGTIANPNDVSMLQALSTSSKGNNDSRYRALCAYKRIQLRQLTSSDRVPHLLKELDDSDVATRDCAYVELYNSTDPQTNTMLKKYIKEPGHRGYREAQNALSSR